MTDRAFEPASPDPFDQFDPDKVGVLPPKPRAQRTDSLAQFDPYPDEEIVGFGAPSGGDSSTLGAFGRGAARGAAPAAGSVAGWGAGAEAGFVGGAAIGGPFAEITGPVGGVVGALAGGYFGGQAVEAAQHWALSKLPDSWREKIGMDDRQEQLDQGEHPVASFLGSLVPFAVTMRPGGLTTAKLPENATALQRIMAHPATARVFGGAVMGGMELGQEAIQGESSDWTKVAIATGFGMVFNKPTKLGESITEFGARPARVVLGRPHPTVAQASELNIAGPGVTKEVFEGSHERDPSAAAAAQETARTEQDTIGEPKAPSPYDIARRMEPETFKRWDALQGERNSIRTWIEQFGGTDSAYRNLHEVSDEMVGLEPQVKAAYRRAAEATGTPFIEPEPPEAPVAAAVEPAPPLPPAPEAAAVAAPVAPVKPIEEQKASIVADVKRRLMAGNPSRNVPGRPADEAESGGRLTAARYEALANWFKGKLGTAEEIYEREAPEIRWHGERADQTSQPRGRRTVNEEKLSLAQFLAHRGGLKPTGDLKAIFDRNPFMPGHGSLFRETGMTLDHAREAAVEAGYINPSEFIGRAGGENTTKISDLLDALQEEARGRKVYRPGYEPETARDADHEAHERALHEDQQEALEPHEAEGDRPEPPSHLTEEDRRVMEELFQETGNRDTGTVHSVDASGNPQSFVDPKASQWVLYHGTPSPVPFERFEPTAANRHLSSKTEEGALFLSPAPEEAAHYAGGETSLGRGEAGPRIYPVHVTPGKTRVFDLNEMALHDPEFRRIMREQHSEYANMPTSAGDRERFGAIFDQRLKDWEDRRKHLQELYSPENLRRMVERGEIDQEAAENAIKNPLPLDHFPGILSGAGAAIRMAREQGLDTAIIRGLKESNGGDQVVVLTPNRVRGALARDRVLFQRDPAPPFYSAVERAIENAKQDKASPQQWLGTLKNMAGVKPEELAWLGLEDWLKEQSGQVTRAEIEHYVKSNRTLIREVQKGGPAALTPERLERYNYLNRFDWEGKEDLPAAERQEFYSLHARFQSGTTKYPTTTIPGGQNYREFLLTLPPRAAVRKAYTVEPPRNPSGVAADREWRILDEASNHIESRRTEGAARQRAGELSNITAENSTEDYNKGHFDEPNVVAHIRFDDRTIDGKKTLFIQEVQSDWHQQGKKGGYRNDSAAERDLAQKQREALLAEKQKLDEQLDAGSFATGAERNEALFRSAEIGIDLSEFAGDGKVPDAPFKTTWPELTLKRMIRHAAEQGYDQISWPASAEAVAQVEGWGKIENRDGKWIIRGDKDVTPIVERYLTDLPRIANKLGKKFDAKVGKAETDTGEKPNYRMVDRYEPVDPARPDKAVAARSADGALLGTAHQEGGSYRVIADRPGGRLNELVSTLDDAKRLIEDYVTGNEAQKARTAPVYVLPLTDKLSDAAMEQGFPLFQPAKGSVTFRDGMRPIMRLMRTADASTFMHESAHDWLEQLMRFSEHPLAPDEMRVDATTVKKWLGIERREELNVSVGDKQARDKARAAHEKFATGFEQYLREGVAPSKELAGVFAKFKQWLLAIYKSLQGLGEPISEDIRGVFDRLLSASPERTVISAEHPPQDVSLLNHIHPEDARLIEPTEAEPGADRVFVELDRHVEELPKEVQAEFEANIAETAAAEAEGWAGANPAAEAGAGTGRSSEVDGAGGKPEPVAGSGVDGAKSGDVGPGGSDAVSESGGVSGAASAAQRRPDDAGSALRDQPLAPRPADTLKPADTFNVGKSGNVRVENITSVPQLVQAIDEASQRIPGGGAITMGDMMALADDLAIDPSTISEAHLARMFGGVQNLSAKIWALRNTIKESAQIVVDTMKRAGQSGADTDLAAMAEAMGRHDMLQSVLSSVTTETGRGLGMSFRNLEGWEKAQDLKIFLEQNTGRTLFQLQRMAKLGAQLDSPAKVSKFLRDAQKRSFGKMVLEYWINGLISGVATHMTYAEGNMILSLWKAVPETLTAAAIGRARAALGRPGERIRAGEALAGPRAMLRGLPTAAQAMIEAGRTGQTTLLPGETAHPLMPFQGDTTLVTAKNLSNDPVTWREVGGDAYALLRGVRDAFTTGSALLKAGGAPGAPVLGFNYSPLGQIPDIAYRGVTVLPLGSAIRIPGRGVAAIHSFFRTLNYLREGAAEAYRTAADEGREGTAFASRVADIRTNPSAEQMERWRYGATELTLMGQGGKFVKAMSQLTNATVDLPLLGETAPLKFIDPFVHIGANVIKQAVVERTPVGILSAEIRADLMGRNGNIAQDMASARMLAGTAVSLLFGGLAMEGFATGSGPTDRNVAEVWKAGGYLPHSIRIGDLWYDVHKLGPMGMLMGIAADMADVAHEASKGELLTAASHLQHAITQNILDESFMRGPSDLIKAVDDPGRYGEAYLRTMLSSFVPFSVGMAQMARAADPYTRQARTVMDAIKAKIPGLSETLMPRRDIWGDEIPNLEALGAKGLTAIYIKRISNDPVNVAMINLGMGVAKVERTIRNVQLTDQQYDDFARIAGRTTKMRLDAIVRSPDWRTWPNHVKHDVIQESIRQSREAGRSMVMMKYPQIIHDATDAKLKKMRGE